MKLGIISDTHDDINSVKSAIKIFNSNNVAYVFHAGDYVFPGIVLEFGNLNDDIKFIGILGNNDGESIGLVNSFRSISADLPLDFGEYKVDNLLIGIYHGTNTNLTNSLILGNRYDIFIYGHTHKKDTRKIGKTQLFNPGSAHKNLQKDDSNNGASVIIYDTILKKHTFFGLNR
jgi:putative phosphoesterase